eukprot:SAG31_NODE_661_length_13035_cov_12.057591_8_plen_104_part_00
MRRTCQDGRGIHDPGVLLEGHGVVIKMKDTDVLILSSANVGVGIVLLESEVHVQLLSTQHEMLSEHRSACLGTQPRVFREARARAGERQKEGQEQRLKPTMLL